MQQKPSVTLHARIQRALQAGAHGEAARLLADAPNDASFAVLRGIYADVTAQKESAADLFAQVPPAHKDWLVASYNLARTLLSLRKAADAVTRLNEVLKVEQTPQAYLMLADAYEMLQQQDSANHAWKLAIDHGARNSETVSNYWLGRRKICDWVEPLPHFGIGDLTPAAATVLSDDPVYQKQVAEHWCCTRLPQTHAHVPQPKNKNARLRVGYISADIHHHATAYLIAELFSLHNKDTFETFCLSCGPDDHSAIRARIKNSAEHFIDLYGSSLADAVRQVTNLGLDVLVDLKGHTRGHVLSVLAARPAPVQVHYLGHPGTIGAPFIDYLVADAVVAPTGAETHYSEKLLQHPGCYQINDRVRPVANTLPRQAYGLPDNAVVLACFNQTHKLAPDTFDLWCDILQTAPHTVLWLYSNVTGAEENLRKAFANKGLSPERLVIAGPLPNDQHLARYKAADVVLDTYPYGGHTTTSDALWAGVPVVTKCGKTFASRVAASLLTYAELPQLITESDDHYKNMVLRLAENPADRALLRKHLEDKRGVLRLFDTPRWVKDWEALLERIAV